MHLNLSLIVIAITFVFNAIFSAYEMALASISRARLTVLINHKRKGAEEAAFMKDRMEASLAVVQLGMTFMTSIAAAIGGAGVVENFSPYLQGRFGLTQGWAHLVAFIFIIIPLSSLIIVFAELIPKMFALNNKILVCLALSPAMKIVTQTLYPIINIFEWIVKKVLSIGHKRGFLGNHTEDQMGLHELNAAVALARTSRLITAREEKIVLAAAQLSVRPVREIMLAAQDISMIPIHVTLSDALIRAHLDMHTRFPVCTKEGDPQTVEGYVNFKDIMMALKLNPADPSIKGIVRPIKIFDGETPISQVMEAMIQGKLHIALVGTAAKRVTGMITLEDIIEELVGEIEDEFDKLPTHIHLYGAGWIMGGGIPMNLLGMTTGLSLSPEESTLKLAEWCAQKYGKPFQGGEVIQGPSFNVTVRKLRRKKVSEAIVTLANNSSHKGNV